MGAGRKTVTPKAPSGMEERGENSSASARNLPRSSLGGVIFGTKHTTVQECFRKQLFGLPYTHGSYVEKVEPGLPLFLFNYSDRKMHGVFEAASKGQMKIDPYAWSEDGSVRSPFPAQVRFHVKMLCSPLLETEFKKAISDNYYTRYLFWFELDHKQAHDLTLLFRPLPVPTSIKLVSPNEKEFPPAHNPWNKPKVLPPHPESMTSSGNGDAGSSDASKNLYVLSELDNLEVDGLDDKEAVNSSSSRTSVAVLEDNEVAVDDGDFGSSLKPEGEAHDLSKEVGETRANLTDSEQIPMCKSSCTDMLRNSEGYDLGTSSHAKVAEVTSSSGNNFSSSANLSMENVLEKLQHLALVRGSSIASTSKIDQCPAKNFPEYPASRKEMTRDMLSVEETVPFGEGHTGHSEIVQTIKALIEKTAELEKKQIESTQELQLLRSGMRVSQEKIDRLEGCIKKLNENLLPSSTHADGTYSNVSEQKIYLVGGYDGSSWLATVEAFLPREQMLLPLKSMSFSRSYACATTLDNHIFVFGGGDGSSWHSTVECYSTESNEWSICAELTHPKGSLAGASLNDKIFAIGGGDGNNCFSEVEMFDPALGRWICIQSMLQKRFAPAAVEFNNALYVVGGYDGSSYLQSAERYDPREGYWTRLPSLNSRRGCHTLTVLNDTLFATGGFDGTNMVSSVENLDPRGPTWLIAEPMSAPRGYASAVLMDKVLYVIGGLKTDKELAKSVECYWRGGWSTVAGWKSVGSRCFSSAVTL